MAHKINKRKAIQAAKRKAEEQASKRKRHWLDEETRHQCRVGVIAHHNGSAMALAALLLGSRAFGGYYDR